MTTTTWRNAWFNVCETYFNGGAPPRVGRRATGSMQPAIFWRTLPPGQNPGERIPYLVLDEPDADVFNYPSMLEADLTWSTRYYVKDTERKMAWDTMSGFVSSLSAGATPLIAVDHNLVNINSMEELRTEDPGLFCIRVEYSQIKRIEGG